MKKRLDTGNYRLKRIAKVNGLAGEWAVIHRARDNTRVAQIGTNGEVDHTTEILVPTCDVVDVKPSHVTHMGGRGALILPAEVRKRYGFDESALVQIVEEPDGVFLRKVRVVPADSPETASLEALLDLVTPENLHEEVDFGPAVGAEAL